MNKNMNKNFSFLNDDINRKIFEFGYPEYRGYIQTICKDIQNRNYTLSKVQKQITDAEMKELLDEFFKLKNCRCCSRHSHNKPEIQVRTNPKCIKYLCIIQQDDWLPECKNLHDCDCLCRHHSRTICDAISFRARKNRPVWS
jgi:hypothetical protein